MRKTTKYYIEYKCEGEIFYRESFNGLKSKLLAIKLAKESIRDGIIAVRIVEQTRKVVKVLDGKEKK